MGRQKIRSIMKSLPFFLLANALVIASTPSVARANALGSVRGVAFEDANGNGAREPGEPLLAGMAWRISAGTWSVTGVSGGDGTFGPTVRPGTYTLTGLDSPGWIATTPARTAIVEAAGKAVLGNDLGYRRGVGNPGASAGHPGTGVVAAPPGLAQAPGSKIPDVLASSQYGTWNYLMASLKATGLLESLYADGDYTIFAPTDYAFSRIPRDRLDAILLNRGALIDLVRNHIVPKRITPAMLPRLRREGSLGPNPVTFAQVNGVTVLNKSGNVSGGVETRNGVVYSIDAVLDVSLK
jgi:uncharacterized surface protein with fasciclin (FAS1) repeats